MGFLVNLPNGIGEALADSLVVNTPLFTTGLVWYVHHTGTDAVAPAGRNRAAPLATLEQAQTNASDGDIIVLKDGHAELVDLLTISKRLVIVGGGESDGLPTVKLTSGGSQALIITADGVRLRNIWFVERDEDGGTDPRLDIAASRFVGTGLYFPCGQYDEGPAVEISTVESSIRFRGCTWKSTATAGQDQPESGLKTTAAVTGLVLEDCVADGGEIGFSNHWAIDLVAGGEGSPAVHVEIENISLLRGADVRLGSASTGWVGGISATSDGSVDFSVGG